MARRSRSARRRANASSSAARASATASSPCSQRARSSCRPASSPLARRQLGVDGADLAGQQPAARLRQVGLDAAQLLGGARLAAQRRELRADLALQQIGAFQVAAHLAELELGALAPPLERAQSGGLLDLVAPVLRLAGEERLDLALTDDRVQLLAQTDLRHEFHDVREPAAGLVDEVLGRAVASDAPHDAHLGGGQRQRCRRHCRR